MGAHLENETPVWEAGCRNVPSLKEAKRAVKLKRQAKGGKQMERVGSLTFSSLGFVSSLGGGVARWPKT